MTEGVSVDLMMRDHILAGLRLLEAAIAAGSLHEDVREIATNEGKNELADRKLINEWCEHLNMGFCRNQGTEFQW